MRNAEASLVEFESRVRHYKRILLFLRAHGCKYECKQCIFHVIVNRRFLRVKNETKLKKHCAITYVFENVEMFC